MYDEFESAEDGRSEEIGRLVDDVISPETKLDFFRSSTGVVLDSALKGWEDMWKELDGCVSPTGEVLPHAERTFIPRGGWKRVVSKMMLIKFHLEYIKRQCEE